MIYDIESKNDLSGLMLVVRFPEEEVDRKALYTIQADRPDFLVPFRYRSVDEMAECTYELGSRSKLQYRFGVHTPREYVYFWSQILQPLLECGDWFLKPFSFVLDSQYLYADRDGAVSYLYIPSQRDCVTFETLREMAVELSRKNSVSDPAMENKVLRAIMQDFQPKAFLQMLRQMQPGEVVAEEAAGVHRNPAPPVCQPPVPQSVPAPAPAEQGFQAPPSFQTPPAQPPRQTPPPPVPQTGGIDDIVIQLNSGGDDRKGKKEKKEKKPLFGGKKEKPEKKSGGLFGKKEPQQKEIFLGAAAESFSGTPPLEISHQMSPQVAPQMQYSGVPQAAPVWAPGTEDCEITQLMDQEDGKVCLRLVGEAGLPREIAVDIQPGQAFTIGRFDVSVGHRQSDFEFDKKTKAVSRRHAAVERCGDGSYVVVDLTSSAGTFVDGQKLTPNVPHPLHRGSRVSFGTGGADYIWEE